MGNTATTVYAGVAFSDTFNLDVSCLWCHATASIRGPVVHIFSRGLQKDCRVWSSKYQKPKTLKTVRVCGDVLTVWGRCNTFQSAAILCQQLWTMKAWHQCSTRPSQQQTTLADEDIKKTPSTASNPLTAFKPQCKQTKTPQNKMSKYWCMGTIKQLSGF